MSLAEKIDVLQTRVSEMTDQYIEDQKEIGSLGLQVKQADKQRGEAIDELCDQRQNMSTLLAERDVARGIVKAFLDLKVELP